MTCKSFKSLAYQYKWPAKQSDWVSQVAMQLMSTHSGVEGGQRGPLQWILPVRPEGRKPP